MCRKGQYQRGRQKDDVKLNMLPSVGLRIKCVRDVLYALCYGRRDYVFINI